ATRGRLGPLTRGRSPGDPSMPTYRYPVLVCRDPAGAYSAVAVDADGVGFGPSAADARNDLCEYLRWFHRKSPWAAGPDFRDPELRWFAVAVRPEYRTKERLYPSETTVEVPIPCVVGTRESGQPTADLPLLGVRFDYPGRTELKDLVRRYALQKLEGLPPHELARFLPPASAELAEIAVPVPKDRSAQHAVPVPTNLGRIAEAVG